MQQFVKNTVDTFKTYIYENNRKVIPTSATLTVYKPASTTVLVDAAAMTVASDGLLSYSLTTAHNDTLGEAYKAVVAYVVSGTTYYLTLYYNVVNSKLHQVVTDADLTNELPQLSGKMFAVHATVDSGSTSTIVADELKMYEDDYFTGGLATNLTSGEIREVTDFVSSTGTATTTTFATANAAGDNVRLQRSFARETQRAFEKIEEEIKKKGKQVYLILDPYDLREVHILFSVAEVCKGMAIDSASFWWDMWKDYEEKASNAFNSLNFKYDASGDGILSDSETGRRVKMSVRYPTLR